MNQRMMIAILPDRETHNACLDLNRRLRDASLSPELFLGNADDPAPRGIPHLSMIHFMVTDANREAIEDHLPVILMELGEEFGREAGGELIDISLYRRGFVSVDVVTNNRAFDLHWLVLDNLRPYIKERVPSKSPMNEVERKAWEEFGFVNCADAWHPHFTVGRLPDTGLAWRDTIENVELPVYWDALSLVYGRVGDHGILETAELSHPLK